MAFTPVNELERLLISASSDPAARPAFYRALMDQELLVITEGQKPAAPGMHVAGDDESFKIRLIDIKGTPHAPIFTSEQRISTVVKDEVGFLAMKGAAVFEMLRSRYLILNPGSEYGKLFPPAEVDAMLTGSIFAQQQPVTMSRGTKVLFAQPKDYPHRLTDALSRFFARSRDVKAAYLALQFVPDSDSAAHILIGIEVDGDFDKIIGEAGVVIRDVTPTGDFVDIVRIHSNPTDTAGNYLKNETKPFYVRKKWLGLF
jgi:hypothetical protein